MFKPTEKSEIENFDFDLYELNRQLDIAKSKVFMGKSAAFLGPLMSMMNFFWSLEVPTAATNGHQFWWNPIWFLKLDPEVRKTVLVHELWHPARLHMVRCGDRDSLIWNYACDIRINNDLDKAGFSFHGVKPWLDHSFDAKGRMAEEDIYDALMNQGYDFLAQLRKLLGDAWSGIPKDNDDDTDCQGDMVEPDDKDDIAKTIENVVQAAHQARVSGHAGDVPGEIETLLKQFLSPVVAWEILLQKFFHDLVNSGHSWSRPNRRYSHIYLPSRTKEQDKLDHLRWYFDVSGSVTDSMAIRMISEVKYIWDTFKPKKLSIAQFDTRITTEHTYEIGDEIHEVEIIGRGSTDLAPVREDIIKEKPTAVVIFTDLGCARMEKLPFDVPVMWICIGNPSGEVDFGELIHIRG